MKKLSLLFCSILTAFCLCVPTNVKATESTKIDTYALVTSIPVQKTTAAYVTFETSTLYSAKICVDLDGSYLLSKSGSTTTVKNVDLTAKVTQLDYSGTTLPSGYKPYVESVKKTIKSSGVDVTVTIGLKTKSSDATVYVSNPPKFNFSV